MGLPATPIRVELGHVCMNHFAVLDLRDGPPSSDEVLAELAVRICSSPFADDLLVLHRSEVADVGLRIFGADGREADCCGNGSLLTASICGEPEADHVLTIETCRDVRRATRRAWGWSVELGPVKPLDTAITLPDDVETIALVRAGEPHLVIRAPEEWDEHVSRIDFERYCRRLRDSAALEGGINVTMVFHVRDDHVVVRTFERGTRRQSYSCGTGSIAAVFALFSDSPDQRVRIVSSPGGCHHVCGDGSVWELVGMPHPIAVGYLSDDTLHFPIDALARVNLFEDEP